jgi:hypothetical protein
MTGTGQGWLLLDGSLGGSRGGPTIAPEVLDRQGRPSYGPPGAHGNR